jgi:hypothetical protein
MPSCKKNNKPKYISKAVRAEMVSQQQNINDGEALLVDSSKPENS